MPTTPTNTTPEALDQKGAAPAAKKKMCALLDDKGVYQGMVEYTHPSELTDKHLPEIDACDLPLGKYYWDAGKKTFWPIRPVSPERQTSEANTLKAIYQGFKAMDAAFPQMFPKVTKDWLRWYGKSFDARDGKATATDPANGGN
jgi:hypothetical protein